ncbi:MAG: transcriptional coactivator p15/PC4 family protein [Candidatus Omnitrophica bacterium]|nr:transcriptional coactivator p15/PC4 family protein [Candidatus Omnitrophota bacterium]
MSQKLIYNIPLREDEEIQVSLKEFKGNMYCDMRVYFNAKDQDIKLPSKKGLTLRTDLLDALLEGLTRAKEELVSMTLMKAEA